ncbi:MAG: hypothetical protein PHU21_12715 [Elusimicrobia bacterium]|nr:hypothetical protein [Elusimicrobiota bacterium]
MKCPSCSAEAPDGSAECPACGLIFAKWTPERESLMRARLEPPLPDWCQEPVGRSEKTAARVVMVWLYANCAVLAVMAIVGIIAVPFSALCACLAWFSWVKGGDARAVARGSRTRPGPKKRTKPVNLGGPSALSLALFFCWVLSSIMVVKFGALIRKASEGSCKGNLGFMRSALSIYYGDLEGHYPSDLGSLSVGGKYLKDIPRAATPRYHPDSDQVRYGASSDDQGGWLYNNTAGDPNFGTLLVNCTHTDTRGTVWTSY